MRVSNPRRRPPPPPEGAPSRARWPGAVRARGGALGGPSVRLSGGRIRCGVGSSLLPRDASSPGGRLEADAVRVGSVRARRGSPFPRSARARVRASPRRERARRRLPVACARHVEGNGRAPPPRLPIRPLRRRSSCPADSPFAEPQTARSSQACLHMPSFECRRRFAGGGHSPRSATLKPLPRGQRAPGRIPYFAPKRRSVLAGRSRCMSQGGC